ncbi:MAG: leucine--tRNA ligase [Ignisphaera sp.]
MANNVNEYFVQLAYKWSKILNEEKLYQADPDSSKPKFFITAAYMYPNGPIHIGHGRTYLIADIIARFKRLQGYNVLFPMGFHYTGTPIITMAEAIENGDKDLIYLLKNVYGVTDEDIKKMVDPLYLARYFHSVSKEVMKLYGLSIDWRREFTTIDEDYKSFIQWQFLTLYEKGYIERGTHPVGWCPRHEMPVGMHDTKGDVEPEIGEFVAILFRDENGVAYPTATLRPETIFGVTNIWVNPDRYYLKIRLNNGDLWIVGEDAASRLKYQLDFEVVDRFLGNSLIGIFVTNPITGERVPVLSAPFVDTSFATGIVMSVPAHAPYDAIALEDIKSNEKLKEFVSGIAPKVIIEVDGERIATAYQALKQFKILSQTEREKLDEATRYVYSLEYQRGFMIKDLKVLDQFREYIEKEVCGSPVKNAREAMKNLMVNNNLGVIVYEILNRPVYCRCGTEIVVKLLKDQWFINYGNESWKTVAREALEKMKIVPPEARAQFEATIDWLKRRACARTRGLGTPLPWDEKWIIESLSDSTIYMAFYTAVHRIREILHGIKALPKEFWDYIFLGKGDSESVARLINAKGKDIEDLRKEFLYWYPLDMRVSGKDLIPNHLTFFIFNHVALFPSSLWPKGIIANGWVLIKQQKMSKSARNIIPLKNLIDEYGTDIVRLLLALNAEVYQDENIDMDMLSKLGKSEYPQLLLDIHDMIIQIYNNASRLRAEETTLDQLFFTKFDYIVNEIVELMEEYKLREAGIKIFYEIKELIDSYLKLVETPSRRIINAIKIWLGLISVYTPYIAEEIWSKTFAEGRITAEVLELPKGYDKNMLMSFRYADTIIDHINNIAKALKKPSINLVVVYVASKNMQKIMKNVLKTLSIGLKVNDIIDNVSKEMNLSKKEFGKVIKALYDVAVAVPEDLRKLYMESDIDELDALKIAKIYIEKRLNARVMIYDAEDPTAPDYGAKKKIAQPLRPGIYVE